MSLYLGEIAALGASASWAVSSIFFTDATQRLGSAAVNRLRLLLAVPFLAAAHWLFYGSPAPAGVTTAALGWIALSGLCAHVLGDGAIYEAYACLGPRLAMLCGSLTPVFSTLLAWVLLGERLSSLELAAIAVILGALAWVVTDQTAGSRSRPGTEGKRARGLALALANPAFQAVGLLAARQALDMGVLPLSAMLLRVIFSVAVTWVFAAQAGRLRGSTAALRADRRALLPVVGGTIVGPLIGGTLSLVALGHAPMGVASTLMSLSPVLILPLARWRYHDRITPRAVLGTMIVLAGAAGLSMLP